MIKGVFIINNNGKARLIKCYEHMVSKNIVPRFIIQNRITTFTSIKNDRTE